MKSILIATLVSGLALAPAVYANDAHHPDKGKSVKAAVVASEQPPVDQTARRMQENVKRMDMMQAMMGQKTGRAATLPGETRK